MPEPSLGNSDWNVNSALAQMQLGQMEETDTAARVKSPWTGGDTLSSDQIDRLLTKLNIGRPFLTEPKDTSQTNRTAAAAKSAPQVPASVPSEKLSIQMDYHTNFELELTKYAEENKLTPKEENALRALHYAPSMGVKNQEALQSKLDEIENRALGKSGLSKAPEDPDSEAFFKKTVQFDYQKNVETLLKKELDRPLPEKPEEEAQAREDRLLLQKVLADPTQDKEVPPRILSLANNIRATANAQTKDNFSITWNPAGPALWGGSPASLNVAIYADQLQTAFNNMVKDVPPRKGPVKAALLDLLGLIGRALAELQSSIYQMETEKASTMSKQQLGTKDMMDAQIAIRDKFMAEMKVKQEEMAAQQAKANQMHDIMQIVGPIVIALSVAAAVLSFGTATVLSAMVTTVMLGLMIHDQVNKDHAVMGMLTKAIADGMVKEGWLSERDAMIVATVIVFVMVIVIMMGTAYASAPSNVASSATSAATEGAAEGLKEGASASLEAAEKAAAASVQISAPPPPPAAAAAAAASPDASAATTFVQIGAPPPPPAAAAAAASATPDASAVNVDFSAANADASGAEVHLEANVNADANVKMDAAAVVDKGTAFKAKMAMLGKMLRIGSATVKLGAAGAGVASAEIEKNMKEIQGDMGIISARANATDDKFTDLMEQNQKLIEMILKLLASLTKWNESVSKDAAAMWKKNKIDFPV